MTAIAATLAAVSFGGETGKRQLLTLVRTDDGVEVHANGLAGWLGDNIHAEPEAGFGPCRGWFPGDPETVVLDAGSWHSRVPLEDFTEALRQLGYGPEGLCFIRRMIDEDRYRR